jgi:hypothetical protein
VAFCEHGHKLSVSIKDSLYCDALGVLFKIDSLFQLISSINNSDTPLTTL